MKTLICLLVAGATIAGSAAQADQGRGRGKPDAGERTDERRAVERPAAKVNVVFSPREITLIRTHYASQYRNLPPGLQKKLARGGTLPPGWQKKMQPFPATLERDLVVLPRGYRRGVMDGHAVIYDAVTHAILDIASLF